MKDIKSCKINFMSVLAESCCIFVMRIVHVYDTSCVTVMRK